MKRPILVLLYAVAGFLTFGYKYHRGGSGEALLAGIWWPAYWTGSLSIRLMEPAETPGSRLYGNIAVAYGDGYTRVIVDFPKNNPTVRVFPLPK